jgi:uncharacterized membrane protein HdeD (DUF308 family)
MALWTVVTLFIAIIGIACIFVGIVSIVGRLRSRDEPRGLSVPRAAVLIVVGAFIALIPVLFSTQLADVLQAAG